MEGRILVVEDDATNLELITELLEDEGYSPLAVEDGEQALAALQQARFDLVILDWMLPGISGIDVLRRIKEDPATTNTPVIMQSAKAYPESVSQGLENGACHYLTKPFSKEVLLSMVRSSLEQKQRLLEVEEQAERKLEEIKVSFLNMARRQRSIRLDLETYKQITSFFTRSLGCTDHKELAHLLMETVNQFSFPSAGKNSRDRRLRCSIRLMSDREINISDRGIETKFDVLVLQRAMESGNIIQQGTYTAVPSESRQTAIMIRNTPTGEEEALKAIEIVSILLERFEERLVHFENELAIAAKNRELEKRASQIKNVIRSCSEELTAVNTTYQEMKTRQMAIFEELAEEIIAGMPTLTPDQKQAINAIVQAELIASMELYSADQITDQKFLRTIQHLNELLAENIPAPETPGSEYQGISQQEVDELLASLAL